MLEKLESPPIVEVICGIVFPTIPGLDPVALGVYWERRRADFPGHDIRPALEDVPAEGLVFRTGAGPGPLRVWFVSADDSFVLQLQHDRFYLNWRRKDGRYPRFSSGNAGLLDRTLAEFGRFCEFCDETLGGTPQPARIELGKIDHFVEGRAWADKDDLGKMVPSLGRLLSLSSTQEPNLMLRLQERREDHGLSVTLSTMVEMPVGRRALRMETTVLRAVQSDVREAFIAANETANRAFEELIPAEERPSRFQKKENG